MTMKMMPKKRVIRIAVETMFSLNMESQPGSSMSSSFLSKTEVLPGFLARRTSSRRFIQPAALEARKIPNICWWPIANPAPSVSSWVGPMVRLEPTAQYRPRMIVMKMRAGTPTRPGKQNMMSHSAVAACCTWTLPVVKMERSLVCFLAATRTMFRM